MHESARFDLDALEFRAVRELLLERLVTTLGRREVEELGPLPSAEQANDALRVADEPSFDAL